MHATLSRRRWLMGAAAGLSTAISSRIAFAQTVPQPARPVVRDETFVAAPVSIDVNARPISSFDPRDRSHLRFGALEWRSGLVLNSPFRGFGGLSAIRLDAKGERF